MMRSLKETITWCTRAQTTLGIATGALLLAFYFFVYGPCTSRLAQLGRDTQTALQEVRTNHSRSDVRTEIAARNAKLRLELDRIKKPASQQEMPALIKDLDLFASQSTLKKFSYKPGTPTRGELYLEVPFSLTFDGDFVNVFDFLRSTEQMQRLTRVRTLTLHSKDSSVGQISAQLTLNTYFAIDE